MAYTEAYDFNTDSDDDLPTVESLLTRLPSRTQYKYSPTRPISTPIRPEPRNNCLDYQNTDEVDSLSDSGDIKSKHTASISTKKKIPRESQSSPEQVDDDDIRDVFQRKRQLKSTPNSRQKELGLPSCAEKTNGSHAAPSIEPQAPLRHFWRPSEAVDKSLFHYEAGSKIPFSNANDSLPRSTHPTIEGFSKNDPEKVITRAPRNPSPGRAQSIKSDQPPSSLEQEDGRDLSRPFSRLRLDHLFGEDIFLSGLDSPSSHTKPTKKVKQKGSVSPRRETHTEEAAPQKPRVKAAHHQEPDSDLDEPLSPCKTSRTPSKASQTVPSKKQTKKSFDAKKCQLAADFLQQLDTQITSGKIAELTESTGGVKIVWSNTLKTTAGRANWKREAVSSSKTVDKTSTDVKQYRHHSSIELAEKVINDEQRLFNVIAHEFCHLANFMINGITDNPHGKEFKVWAAKCSQLFGSQGIKVTTKHTYEIDFKYVWKCTACACEYKRHSKSIDPKRHRCGACKALLEQTKPVPRQTATSAKLSEYQQFVKEQMKIVKSENADIPQKEVMRVIADKWAKIKT